MDEAIVIRDVPVQEQTTASINVVYVTVPIQSQQLLTVNLFPHRNRIEQDDSLPPPPRPPIRGFSDRRRVKVLNEVVLLGRVSSQSV